MSATFYDCTKCGQSFGIAGESTGSADDIAADDYFTEEVEYHESGQCMAAAAVVDPEPVKADPRAEYIAGWRLLLDMLEADPSLPLPYPGSDPDYARCSIYARTKEQLQAWARAIPGRKDKNVTDSGAYGFELICSLRGLHLLILGHRDEVCERVVTGTREVTRTVPAPDAPMVEVTETVEDVEWRCHPLLAEAVEPEAVSA